MALKRVKPDRFLGISSKSSGRFCGAVLYNMPNLKYREKTIHRILLHMLSYEV